MTSQAFIYWLQGFFEIRDADPAVAATPLTPAQEACIKRHLAMVFVHELDPSMGDAAHQEKLNEAHKPPEKPAEPPKPPWQSHGTIGGPPGPHGENYRC